MELIDRLPQAHSFCLFALLVVATGCADVHGGSVDTVVVNSSFAVLDADSRVAQARSVLASTRLITWQSDSNRAGRVSASGTVQCDSIGDLHVARTSLRGTRTHVVRCRPVATLDVVVPEELSVDDTSQFIRLDARSPHGEQITTIAAMIRVADTSIVQLEGDRIIPRHSGVTRLDVTVGGCHVSRLVNIKATRDALDSLAAGELFRRSLSLVAGQYESMRLPTGNYRIRLVGDTSLFDRLRLAVTNANCAAALGAQHDYFCTTKDNAWVAVRLLPVGKWIAAVQTTLEIERRDPARLQAAARGVSPSGSVARCEGTGVASGAL